MYGGSISGNIITGESDQQGAGVMVKYQGSFNMYGGVIRDNKAVCTADSGSAQGGGVYSAYKFYMYGGTITGNDVSADNPQGGGVFVSGPASMGGTPVIKGNTATVTGQPSKPNNCYEMTFFNRKSQRTFTCQIVQNAKRHLKGAKTMQISGIGHSVIRGLGTTGQWFSASTTVYPRGSPQGRRHSYFVDC